MNIDWVCLFMGTFSFSHSQQKTFGVEVLDYAFIVLTHAGQYFESNRDKSLGDYLREMKETPLAEALRVIGDKVIAVENKGVGYQTALSRQALLDHINHHVARSNKGCYTNALMNEIKAKQQLELQRKKEKRECQKRNIEDRVAGLIEARVSTAVHMDDLVNMMGSGRKEIINNVFKEVKMMPIDDLSPTDHTAYVRDTVESKTKHLLEDLATGKLKEMMIVKIKSTVTDESPGVNGYYTFLERRYAAAIQILGQMFMRLHIGKCIEPLQEETRKRNEARLKKEREEMMAERARLNAEQEEMRRRAAADREESRQMREEKDKMWARMKEEEQEWNRKKQEMSAAQEKMTAHRARSTEDALQRQEILSFILSHIELSDNPNEIQASLVRSRGSEYKERSILATIKECLEEHDVYEAKQSYKKGQLEEKREKDMETVKKSAEECVESFIADKWGVEISECKEKIELFTEWLEEITPLVEQSVKVDLSKAEIKVVVSDHLRVMLDSVTDPDFVDQVR